MPRDEQDTELKPLNIAVAPTARLSEESAFRAGEPTGITPAPRYLPAPTLRPKPPARPQTQSRALLPYSRVSGVPAIHVVESGDLAHIPYSKRVRERGLALCLFAIVSLALCVLSPVGVLASFVCGAVAMAELRNGWAKLSRKATRYAYAAISVAASGVLYQAAQFAIRLWRNLG